MAKKMVRSDVRKWNQDGVKDLPIEDVGGETHHVCRGLFIELKTITTAEYGDGQLLVLDTGIGRDAERQTWGCPKQLAMLLESSRLAVGDAVAIVPTGWGPIGNREGYTFDVYKLDSLTESLAEIE